MGFKERIEPKLKAPVKVSVPELNVGHIDVMTVAASQIEDVAKLDGLDGPEALAAWCVLGAVDPDGLRIWSYEDIPMLITFPLSAIQRIAEAVMTISGLTEDDDPEKN